MNLNPMEKSWTFPPTLWNFHLSFSHTLWKFHYLLSFLSYPHIEHHIITSQTYGISTFFPLPCGNSTILNLKTSWKNLLRVWDSIPGNPTILNRWDTIIFLEKPIFTNSIQDSRIIASNFNKFFERRFSSLLCGFRKSHSTQLPCLGSLIVGKVDLTNQK